MSVNFRVFETPLKLTDKTVSNLIDNNISASLILNGGLFINNTTNATSVNNGGSFTTIGGISIYKDLIVGNKTHILGTEDSVNLSSGALVVSGGLSVVKSLNLGGSLILNNTDSSINSTTGALISYGGISISSTYDSSSSTSGGSLTVAGGASIEKSMYIGNHLIVNTKDITPSLGDITKELRFSGNNNQTQFSDIVGFKFNNDIVRSFNAYVSVEITFYQETDPEYNPNYENNSIYAIYEIKGIQKDSSWSINYSHIGDSTNIVFGITHLGQVQYKSSNYGANFKELDFRFRATTTSINNLTTSSTVDFPYDGTLDYIKLNLNGPKMTTLPGMISWNNIEDCLDVTHADGTILQTGLEQHMKIYNHNGNSLLNGTVVRFSGVNNAYDPSVVPMIADGSVQPLYIVGVVTDDIPVNSTGRATWFGKVRNLNTTGGDVNEVWNEGDILYISPTIAGKLTKIKPTAPNIVISVAAVLKKHETDGIILVRPTIYPRLHYGSFSDSSIQTALLPNTPYAVRYNTTDISNGHSISNNTRIIASNSGLYNYQFSLQLSSNNSSKKEVYVWARKNGTDVPNSSTRITISGNDVYTAASWNFILSMNINDYFELMWATTDTTAKIDAPPANGFSPSTPSVILTVTEAAL